MGPPEKEEDVEFGSTATEQTPENGKYAERGEEAFPPVPKNKSIKALEPLAPRTSQGESPFSRQKSTRLASKKNPKPSKKNFNGSSSSSSSQASKFNHKNKLADAKRKSHKESKSMNKSKLNTTDHVTVDVSAKGKKYKAVEVETVQCYCGASDEEDDMMQCDGCGIWLHGLCAGYVRHPSKS
jgi:hypothetical protein